MKIDMETGITEMSGEDNMIDMDENVAGAITEDIFSGKSVCCFYY